MNVDAEAVHEYWMCPLAHSLTRPLCNRMNESNEGQSLVKTNYD